MSGEERPTVLVTGAAGGLSELVSELLIKKYRLVGCDPRMLPSGRTFPGEFFNVDYRSRKMAEVFRQYRFHALMHLGRLPLGSGADDSLRYNINVLGTRNLLELCARYQVPNIIVCSTFHVYGAHPHNHLYLGEEDPLRASHTFPELIDAVDMDNAATAFLLKHPQIRVVILRPSNVIGPRINNRITNFLRARFCPYVLGYDPPMQFMHEQDFARALKIALDAPGRGVYNVAGEGVIPFTRAIRMASGTPVPLASALAYPAAQFLNRFGVNFPAHLIDYFRYPVVISDKPFRREFGFRSQVSTRDAILSLSPQPEPEADPASLE